MNKARLFVVLCTLALGCLLAIQAEAAKLQLTKQEKYVLQQVATGKAADLKEHFGKKEENRQLSARFLEDLLSGALKVKVCRKGVWILNAVIAEPLDLVDVQVLYTICLVDCRFKESVVLRDAVFEKLLVISGSSFDQGACFERVKVKKDLLCKYSTFQGPVNFRGADIGGQFAVEGAKFLSKDHMANFNGLKVGQSAFFRGAVFQGPVDFTTADIGGQFVAIGAKFLSQDKKANFNSLKASQSAFFRNAVFRGPVDFLSANIGGQFVAIGAKFLSKEQLTNFSGMRVGQSAVFQNVTFTSNVGLRYGTYVDLILEGAMYKKQDGDVGLDLKGTVIQREFRLKNFKLASLEASHLRVKGPAIFQNLVIKDSANFQNATIEALKFRNVKWPRERKNFKLDGLTYTSLLVNEPFNFSGLLGLVERSAFNPHNYLELEVYCKRTGHQDWADDVYIAMKDRELRQMGWYNPGRWLIYLFWGRLAGYGRAPLRIFWLSLGIVILGAFLFDPKHLKEDKRPPDDGKLRRLVLRFLISLDRFLPAVNMRLAENWKAKDNTYPIWLYFTVEQALGWIIIPIALAAIYTQIK